MGSGWLTAWAERRGAAGSMAAATAAGGLRPVSFPRLLRAVGARGGLPWPRGGRAAAAGWSRPEPGGEAQYCAELLR